MKIHVIRHAKTNQVSPSGKDFDRELLPKGIQQCMLIKDYLFDKIESDSLFFASSSKRTKQTTDLVFDRSFVDKFQFLDDLYLMEWNKMLAFVNQLNTTKDVCIIGHNEGISDFVSYITGGQILLKTGCYVCVNFPFETTAFVSKNTASVTDFYQPVVLTN